MALCCVCVYVRLQPKENSEASSSDIFLYRLFGLVGVGSALRLGRGFLSGGYICFPFFFLSSPLLEIQSNQSTAQHSTAQHSRKGEQRIGEGLDSWMDGAMHNGDTTIITLARNALSRVARLRLLVP
jgi:hypothetical protein